MAYADEITGRGLESVFQVTPKASVIGRAQVNYTLAIAAAAGSTVGQGGWWCCRRDMGSKGLQAGGLENLNQTISTRILRPEAYRLNLRWYRCRPPAYGGAMAA
jgi:branched-chain amino acid transport system substrate-binding protein